MIIDTNKDYRLDFARLQGGFDCRSVTVGGRDLRTTVEILLLGQIEYECTKPYVSIFDNGKILVNLTPENYQNKMKQLLEEIDEELLF